MRLAGLALAGLVLAACAQTTAADPAPTAPSSDDDTASAPAFPATIEHAFGSTTIERRPQRVVTVGFTDHDVVLALGVTPIALRAWYGDYDYVWPWAQEALGDATPEVLPNGELSFEQIAALSPDLIIGLYAGLERGEYDRLAQIAPTVAQSGDHPAFGTPWQAMTRTAGVALGKTDDAERLIGEVEDRFAQVRAAHPEFDGVKLAYAGVYDGDKHYVETEGSTRVQHFLDLGFVVPEELAALGADSFYHDLSQEQLHLVDHDIVLWEFADPDFLPAVETNPIYQNLAVARDGRDVYITDPVLAGAMAHSTVLSLPVVLDELVPELAAAAAKLADGS